MMTSVAHHLDYSLDDYLNLEASSPTNHEFLEGQIYAITGDTPEHGALKSALTALLFPRLRGESWGFYDARLRVHVLATGFFTYPDIAIISGAPQRDKADERAILNPTAILEITSPATKNYLRRDKLEHYRALPTLREYIIVPHDVRRLERWHRKPGGSWSLSTVGADETVTLEALGASISVRELYDTAHLCPEATPRAPAGPT